MCKHIELERVRNSFDNATKLQAVMAATADAAPADWLLQSAALAKSAQLCQLSLHATLTTPATKQLLLALVLHLKSASGRMI